MPIRVTTTELPGVAWIDPQIFGDARGFFQESFNQRDFRSGVGVEVDFVHESQYRAVSGQSLSMPDASEAGWLWRVIEGDLRVTIQDARPDSPFHGMSVCGHIDAQGMRQIWIPPGMRFDLQVTSARAAWIGKCTREAGDRDLTIVTR
ncbi:MAG: dTDP-4-dehydrorhamnose 3,5-epimerase family protein [Magnetococcales bacterium]|nr:dTDP-4-dehydrorhamnose 3,5-epimerase family protein [Magnetococcales bacterium]